MSYYHLPATHNQTYRQLSISTADTPPTEHVSHSLARYIYEIKEKISVCEKDWNVHKKYTNAYEYIHSYVPHKKRAVSKYKPLSRSYFKMVELIQLFDLVPRKQASITDGYRVVSSKYSLPTHVNDNAPIRTFHLAEGPGGFIEAVVRMRPEKVGDKCIGMTIIDTDYESGVPSWKRSDAFLSENAATVGIEVGSDGTGNILSLENFDHCCAKYGASMDFITADGGFDFSVNFNEQEMMMIPLLYAQICYAICMQKRGGHFVLKLFDCFHKPTIDLLYLLSSVYKTVYICKPQTSRTGNSEKYVVCKHFLRDNADTMRGTLRNTFAAILESMQQNRCITQILRMPLPAIYLARLEEYNAIFGQQQIENIHYTLSIIDKHMKSEKIDYIVRQNVIKCINWCIKHQIPYHNPNAFVQQVPTHMQSAAV